MKSTSQFFIEASKSEPGELILFVNDLVMIEIKACAELLDVGSIEKGENNLTEEIVQLS